MNERYNVEYLDEERASIHDELENVELTAEEVVERLNSFNEQHELMKQMIQEKIDEYTHLKKVCNYEKRMHNKWKDEALSLQDQLDNAYNENEQLKEIITGQRDTIKRDNEWENKAIEEIKQLTQKNKYNEEFIADVMADCKRLEKENEELKSNCKNYEWYKQYKRLLNENEQLKRIIAKQELALAEARNVELECGMCGCHSLINDVIKVVKE